VLGNMILASTEAASKGSSSGSTTFLLVIVVLIAIMWFVMIRPQRAKQRRQMEQQRGVVPGQRVRTTAGMYATVVDVDGDDVILEVAPGVHARFVKRAIMEVLGDDVPVTPPDEAGYATDSDEENAHESGEFVDAAQDEHAGADATAQADDETRTADTV
jgi:preprotein translocase subunit YajC